MDKPLRTGRRGLILRSIHICRQRPSGQARPGGGRFGAHDPKLRYLPGGLNEGRDIYRLTGCIYRLTRSRIMRARVRR
jgi:hypothetical protein